MKRLISISLKSLILISVFQISACSQETEDRTELSDYKNHHLDKAKAVEKEMQERQQKLELQLEEANGSEQDHQ